MYLLIDVLMYLLFLPFQNLYLNYSSSSFLFSQLLLFFILKEEILK